MVTLRDVFTGYNELFDHMHGVMRAVANKKTQWKDYLFFPVTLAQQKHYKHNAEVTPIAGMVLISAHNLDPVQKLQSFRMRNKGMEFNPEDETSNTAQYQEAIPMSVQN
jgi:hypothetical protein